MVNLVTSDDLTRCNVKKYHDLTDLTIYLRNKQMVIYPLVNLFRLCELEHGPVDSSWIYPATKCWIFPSFFANVYQAG